MFKVITNNPIAKHSPITIDSWDSTNNCPVITTATEGTTVHGINVIPLSSNIVYKNIIITNGTLYHIDTNTYSVGDFYIGAYGHKIGIVRSASSNGSIYLTLTTQDVDKAKYYITPNSSTDNLTYTVPKYKLNSTELYVDGSRYYVNDGVTSNYNYTETDNVTLTINNNADSLIYPDSHVLLLYKPL